MSRYYSDPSREDDTHALPDVEVFYAPSRVAADEGWYYRRLPEGGPKGPFETEDKAVTHMRGIWRREAERRT